MHRSKNPGHRVNHSWPRLNEMKPQLQLTPHIGPAIHCLIPCVNYSKLKLISQDIWQTRHPGEWRVLQNDLLVRINEMEPWIWLLANCVKMIHDGLGRFSSLVFVLSFLGKFRFLVSVNEFDRLIAPGRLHTWKKMTQLVANFMLYNGKAINISKEVITGMNQENYSHYVLA